MSALTFRHKATGSASPNSGKGKGKVLQGKQKPTLYTLPPELRELIFEPFCVDWKGKTPNLIKALRGDSVLYGEALGVFYRWNEFVFHEGNRWGWGDMGKGAVESVGRARVVVQPGIMHQGLWEVSPSKEESVLTPFVPATPQDALSLHELILEFPALDAKARVPSVSHGGLNYHFNYFLKFEHLTKVTLLMPGRIWALNTKSGAQRERAISNSIRLGNSRLGVLAKLETVPAYHLDQDDRERDVVESRDIWFWKAEEGKFLNPPKPLSQPPYSRCQECSVGS